MQTKITISFKSIISDFLFWGLSLSIILNMVDNAKYYIFQLVLIGINMMILGVNGSLKILVAFIRKHQLLAISFLIWTVLAFFQSSIYSSFRVFSFFALIFMGYLITVKNKSQGLMLSLHRIGILLFISVLYGLISFFLKTNPFMFLSERFEAYSRSFIRITSIFLHPIPCATFFVTALIIISTTGKNKLFTTVTSIVCLVGIIYTFSRSAWGVTLIVMFIIYFPKIKKVFFSHKLERKTLIFLIVALLGISIFAVVYRDQLAESIDAIAQRLFKNELMSDESFLWRMSSLAIIIKHSISDGLIGFLFGHGINSGSYLVASINYGSLFSETVIAVDNSYISALYDFGIVGLIFIVSLVVITVILLFKVSNHYNKTICCIVIALLIMAFFYEEIYWCNTGFLFLTFTGVIIALWDKKNYSII